MNSIYASKLYRASKRKDKICAALVNSSNAGLVQQLSENLDDEYKKLNLENMKAKEAKKEAEQNSQGEQQSDEGTDASGVPKSLSSGLSGGSFNPSTDLMPYPEEAEGGEMPEGDMPEGDDNVSVDEEPTEEIQESVDVVASIALDDKELSVLKGGLNSIDGLAGVTRTVNKEGEVWIYYNDDTNLNNIMTDVIDYVAKRYSNLEFNRLARSDNAIVFEIIAASSGDDSAKEKDEE